MAVVIPRFATLYGISPRTRFDLIVNQFVLEALTRRKLVIYQGDYKRSFIHVADVVDALVRTGTTPRRRWSSWSASTCPRSRWSIAI